MKLTEWFGKTVNPGGRGVYEVEPRAMGPWFSYWDGQWWGYMVNDGPEEAVKAYQDMSYVRYEDMDQWRGLAEKP